MKSLVEALGGTVTLQSLPDRGADFRVSLPIVPVVSPSNDAALLTGRAAGRSPEEAASPARVLVAEDNDINFGVLEAYLHKAGHTVERAVNGREAVAGAPGYDLVLMDVEMPEMDGLAATRLIRADERARGAAPVPVIALTAHALQEYRDRCLEAGCTGYLSKPVRMHGLLEAVARALERAGATAGRA